MALSGPSRVGELSTWSIKLRKKMRKNSGKMKENNRRMRNNKEIFLSCPPEVASLATPLESTIKLSCLYTLNDVLYYVLDLMSRLNLKLKNNPAAIENEERLGVNYIHIQIFKILNFKVNNSVWFSS